MKKIEVILNGKSVEAEAGITILELARQHGISIPTLCHDEELKPYGSCWVCAVEVAGRRGFVTSCGTTISSGMDIKTDSEEIRSARKMALELLVSNHYADCEAPCKIACPDHVDIQAYVSLIANGQYHEAVKVIKDTLPMPLSIGRVCPAFCEKECRRQLVEEPVAIRQLKRYAADMDSEDYWNYIPEKQPDKAMRVAIIGAGPSGLTCGYYLSTNGYDVTVYEAAPSAGGWLRYGIPEYRLPKAVLDKEIDLMCANGMKIEYGKELGKDLFLNDLSASFDAIYLAIGAQKAVPMPVKGSDLDGCYLGVDFLKEHAMGKTPPIGKKVAVVGGGNTAIDCARTTLRLGADVSIIYRRTREEMPADDFEIEAAEKEGVHFHYLCNPVEYSGEDNKLQSVKIETMRLGEPDSSGRRRPEPTGEYFTEQFDSIIAAISQVPDVEAFADQKNYIGESILPLSRWQTAIVNEDTMYTGLKNVFAGGDFRRGAATAIEAIADGRVAAKMIDSFLSGIPMKTDEIRFDAKKGMKVDDVSADEYKAYDKIQRFHMPELDIPIACSSFSEVELGFKESDARAEAERCLECGCLVNETCFLRQYCTDYNVDSQRFVGSIGKHPIDYSHPFIVRDQNKCINCGRCIRTCAEIQGAAVLGYIYRGFPTVVAPQFGESLTQSSCESCGKCINVCPVGALTERNLYYKLNPLPKMETIQNCGLCGTGCTVKAETQTTEICRITTPNDDEEIGFNRHNLCYKGRFGWQTLADSDRVTSPMHRQNGKWQVITWQEASELINDRLSKCNSKRIEISPNITIEEMLLMKQVADTISAKYSSGDLYSLFSDNYIDVSPTSIAYQKLNEYQELVVVGKISHTLRTILRLKQREGKRLVLVNHPESGFDRFADDLYSNLSHLKTNSNQLFIYNINSLSEKEIYDIWALANAIDPETKNLMQTSDYSNYLGMLAVKADRSLCTANDFVLGYGRIPSKVKDARFSIALLTHFEGNDNVDLILPLPTYLEINGTALANNGLICKYSNPRQSNLMNQLLKLFYELGWIHPNTAEINYWNEMAEKLLKGLESYKADIFDLSKVKTDRLSNEVISASGVLTKRIEALYHSRSQATKF